nr:PREDICTED: uncharacterized protein LOC106703862 [Latimeria chalumnae]|eukprot:XP_014345022.1 PREDICTED: uncharacterized protein LOC106703862 [Latimeria chalumnae]
MKERAPLLLAEIEEVLKICKDADIDLPYGIKNIFQFTKAELIGHIHKRKVGGRATVWRGLAYTKPATCSLPHTLLAAACPAEASRYCFLTFSEGLESSAKSDHPHLYYDHHHLVHVRSSTLRRDTGSPEHRDEVVDIPLISSTLQLIAQWHTPNIFSYSLISKISEGQEVPMEVYNHNTQKVFVWAREKLKAMLEEIQEQRVAYEILAMTKPLILQHYVELRESSYTKPTGIASLTRGKPRIPATNPRKYQRMNKLRYSLPDGTTFVHYPSGNVAISQIPSSPISSRLYTNVFADHHHSTFLATFVTSGHGWVYNHRKSSPSIKLAITTEGGVIWDKQGRVTKRWTWSSMIQEQLCISYKVRIQSILLQ